MKTSPYKYFKIVQETVDVTKPQPKKPKKTKSTKSSQNQYNNLDWEE